MNSYGSTSSTGSASSGAGGNGSARSAPSNGPSPGPNAAHQPRYFHLAESNTQNTNSSTDTAIHMKHRRHHSDGGSAEELRKLYDQQQKILDQLMKDREGTYKLLKKVEKDISELRGENQQLQVNFTQFHFCVLSYLQSENANLREGKGKLLPKGDDTLEQKLSELTKAQERMASVVEQLQSENAEIPKYLQTTQKQEVIISKLEQLLKFSINEIKKSTFVIDAI